MGARDTAIRCLRDEAQAILDLEQLIDGQLEQAVRIILDCRGKVIVTGVGKSGHIAAKAAATFSSTGTPSFYISPLDLFHGDLGAITRDDVVVAFSNSGQTDELLRLVPYLLDMHIPLIALTGNAKSLLAQYATCHICVRVEHEACPLGLAPTSSTTAALAMSDALACVLIEERGFKAHDFVRFHPGGSLGRRLLTRAADVMRTDNLPTCDKALPLSEALQLVSKAHLALCVAIDGDGRVEGLITDGDMRRAMQTLKERFYSAVVADIMTRKPKCVKPSAKISEIQDIMHRNTIHALLVTDDDGRLLGVVDHFQCMM